jgi:hypothetical protein
LLFRKLDQTDRGRCLIRILTEILAILNKVFPSFPQSLQENAMTASTQIFSNESFTSHPTIQCYVKSEIMRAIKWGVFLNHNMYISYSIFPLILHL